ncbi:MAG: hypothetical protein IPP08_05650 [Chlorobiota bacterium]|nr:MAG: hypothetical protein IPP08_05650 [Chlorobiota bacterium]
MPKSNTKKSDSKESKKVTKSEENLLKKIEDKSLESKHETRSKNSESVTISFDVPKWLLNHLDLSPKEFTRIFRMFGSFSLYALDYLEDDEASALVASNKDFTDHLYNWLGEICEKTAEKYAMLHDILEEEVNEEVADRFEDDMEEVWDENIDNILSDEESSYRDVDDE